MTIPASQYQYSIRLFRRSHAISVQNILLVISAVAIVLRVASAFLQGNSITELRGIYDQISYDSLAGRVVNGYGFSFAENHWPLTRAEEPTAHWSFLYTLYLAGIYALFGHQPLIARVLQAVIVGGVQTYLVYFIAERTFSKTAGLIASGLTASYIYFIYYDGALMTEPFYMVAILWCLFLSIPLAETEDYKQNIRFGIGLGIAVGITILLEEVRRNLGYTRSYADRMNLTAMTPQPKVCSTGYCPVNSAAEGADYLVFLPAGTSILNQLGIISDGKAVVDLSGAVGELSVEWFDPANGEKIQGETVAGGSSETFTTPFSGDAVLYIYDNAP
jgi:hypothetical protein